MKPALALALALLPVIASAAPVQITLKSSAAVQPDAADFFTLGSVAGLSGGSAALRARLAAIPVGRAPLPGDVRHLTPGDLALKLRQAGFQPGRDAVIGEGVAQADVTVADAPPPPAADNGGARAASASFLPAAPESGAAGGTGGVLIHTGDPITIRIDDGPISVTADGVAESGGAAGDTVRVRRTGVASLLDATVVDAQTVELEF